MRLEHDPDSLDEGCEVCPLVSEDVGANLVCDAVRRVIPDEDDTAPTWCPLRVGDVVVGRPR